MDGWMDGRADRQTDGRTQSGSIKIIIKKINFKAKDINRDNKSSVFINKPKICICHFTSDFNKCF